MNVPFLFHVYDRHTSLGFVLVWYTPSWVTNGEDSEVAECNAAYGLRSSAADEARWKGMKDMLTHLKTCRNTQLEGIEKAAIGHDGKGWELILVGDELSDLHLRNFIPLSDIQDNTIANLIVVDVR